MNMTRVVTQSPNAASGPKQLRRMPTVEMVEAGRKAMAPEKFVSHARVLWTWLAMFEAAPAVGTPGQDYVQESQRDFPDDAVIGFSPSNLGGKTDHGEPPSDRREPLSLSVIASLLAKVGADPDQPGEWHLEFVRQIEAAHCVAIPIAAQRITAFETGWRMAAEWAKRDDLNADMDSPAYIAERKTALAAIFGELDAAGVKEADRG